MRDEAEDRKMGEAIELALSNAALAANLDARPGTEPFDGVVGRAWSGKRSDTNWRIWAEGDGVQELRHRLDQPRFSELDEIRLALEAVAQGEERNARKLLALLDRVLKKIDAIRYVHGGTRECVGPEKRSGRDDECGICSVLDCPDDEALHFHHDGCPACARDPACELQCHPNVELPVACYDESGYPFNAAFYRRERRTPR